MKIANAPVQDNRDFVLESVITATDAQSVSNAYFYRRSLDNQLVEVWYDPYTRLWTGYVINNTTNRYQAGPAEYGTKRDVDFIIRTAERRNWL